MKASTLAFKSSREVKEPRLSSFRTKILNHISTWFSQEIQIMQSVLMLLAQVMRRCELRLRARMALAAAHLFLQKQVALYQTDNATWRCDLHATRFTLMWLSP